MQAQSHPDVPPRSFAVAVMRRHSGPRQVGGQRRDRVAQVTDVDHRPRLVCQPPGGLPIAVLGGEQRELGKSKGGYGRLVLPREASGP